MLPQVEEKLREIFGYRLVGLGSKRKCLTSGISSLSFFCIYMCVLVLLYEAGECVLVTASFSGYSLRLTKSHSAEVGADEHLSAFRHQSGLQAERGAAARERSPLLCPLYHRTQREKNIAAYALCLFLASCVMIRFRGVVFLPGKAWFPNIRDSGKEGLSSLCILCPLSPSSLPLYFSFFSE